MGGRHDELEERIKQLASSTRETDSAMNHVQDSMKKTLLRIETELQQHSGDLLGRLQHLEERTAQMEAVAASPRFPSAPVSPNGDSSFQDILPLEQQPAFTALEHSLHELRTEVGHLASMTKEAHGDIAKQEVRLATLNRKAEDLAILTDERQGQAGVAQQLKIQIAQVTQKVEKMERVTEPDDAMKIERLEERLNELEPAHMELRGQVIVAGMAHQQSILCSPMPIPSSPGASRGGMETRQLEDHLRILGTQVAHMSDEFGDIVSHQNRYDTVMQSVEQQSKDIHKLFSEVKHVQEQMTRT